MKNKGSVILEVALVVALLGLGGLWFKNQFFHGDTRRAEASQEATAVVKETVAVVDEAAKKQSAVAAASVVKIGEANAGAPESPEKSFITREVGVALANLEAPDQKALLEAERRRVAVMEGRLEEADKRYAAALGEAEKLRQEREKALRERELAFAERDAIDRKLSEVAAARRAREQQLFVIGLVAASFVALWVWTKFTHLSPWQVAKAVEDMRAKAYQDPVEAIDVAASPLQQTVTRASVKIRRLFQ
jgi:uncharacterized membrane protein YsdA (DUF1294 family)